jgi:CDP-paratose 2-epimerase
MSLAIVTGSGGLVGSEAARYFGNLGFDVVGIDNDMRRSFFGDEASTAWNISSLENELGDRYEHQDLDIRDREGIDRLFQRYGSSIDLIVHCAAQPSHDWAAREPFTDFDINATGTLNMLEATRHHAPEAVFIFTSTNKVYGDTPNALPLVEYETRWELEPPHPYADGIKEDMSIDHTLHSLFGASKVAADVMVQEYGRYFGMKTACFRAGTLTGPLHSASHWHGFIGYVMRCAMTETPYTIFGYKGKQVRDVLHSSDLIRAFDEFYRAPHVAAAYNIGGGRSSHCSVLEAIHMSQEISGRQMDWNYSPTNRVGDHIWWVSSTHQFELDYPNWDVEYDVRRILTHIYEVNLGRWTDAGLR